MPHLTYGAGLAVETRWPKRTPGRRRMLLRLLIQRVVVDEWPAGLTRTQPQTRNEWDEHYATARDGSCVRRSSAGSQSNGARTEPRCQADKPGLTGQSESNRA